MISPKHMDNQQELQVRELMYSIPDGCLSPRSPPMSSADFDLSDASLITPLRLPFLVTAEPAAADPTKPETEAGGEPKGKRRGRKRHYVTDEQKKLAYAKRVERNRYYARENRKRRKQYIIELEGRIESLTAELDLCKKRLAEYEGKERLRCASFIDYYQSLKADTMHFTEQQTMQVASIMQSSAYNMPQIMPVLRSNIENKKKVLDIMAQTVLDVSMPIPCRYMIHMFEDECQCQMKELDEVLGDEATTITRQVRKDWERMFTVMPESRKFLKQVTFRLMDNVNRYRISFESMKKQMEELDFYIIERMTPRMEVRSIENTIRWLQIMMGDPRQNQLLFQSTDVPASGGSMAMIKWMPMGCQNTKAKVEEDTEREEKDKQNK